MNSPISPADPDGKLVTADGGSLPAGESHTWRGNTPPGKAN